MKSIKLEGLADVKKYFDEAVGDIKDKISKEINATCIDIQTTARKMVQGGSKSGTTYFRIPGEKYMTIRAGSEDGTPVAFPAGGGKHNRSMKHRASAAGEAPASDTGDLASMITVDMIPGQMVGYVESEAEYSEWLEYGTKKISPRPFMEPAVRKNENGFIQRVRAICE